MFYYATTRDYSKDEDENSDDDEAFEAYWREFLGEDEEENVNTENGSSAGTDDNPDIVTTGTPASVDVSSEETPENIPPRPKLSLRFKEVHCTTL